MIETEKGCIELKGSVPELLGDFSVITSSLYKILNEELGEKAEELIRYSFEKGLKFERKEEKEMSKTLDNIEDLLNLIRRIKNAGN